MSTSSDARFARLVELIIEVKPGLGDLAVTPEQSLVDDLGLDSLDLLQLARKVNRKLGGEFDLDAWNEEADAHRRSVGSVLAAIEPAAV
ncbi:phosphopantetheine-binding protein [Kitasatospora sp. NPDC048239]|uniref:phosphopantetheine-binding protein n=1 Tax=Kitasatospora sp. NPDC048239 TaxID=3364046 RepID=UPI00371C9A09